MSTGRHDLNPADARMHEQIASFPSKRLYEDRLVSARSVAKRTLLDLPGLLDTTSDEAKDVLEPNVVFFDTAGCEFYERNEGDDLGGGVGEGSKSNANEAEVVVRWARRLVS